MKKKDVCLLVALCTTRPFLPFLLYTFFLPFVFVILKPNTFFDYSGNAKF
jgi:hypothetical protein